MDEAQTSTSNSHSRSLQLLVTLFLISLSLIAIVFYNMPDMEESERASIKLPRDIEDAKELGRVLSRYKETHLIFVTLGVFTTYIFLQTFAIPGSIGLSILSGFLFPFPLALLLVCTCSTIGATNCYLLANLIGSSLISRFNFRDRISNWKDKIDKHKDHLIYYIIFLRITPFLPNWFINIAAPQIGVSLIPFIIGTFCGVAPPSFIFIRAGTTLYTLTTTGDALSLNSILITALLAVLSLSPVAYKKWTDYRELPVDPMHTD
ncbi:hypothetical protein LOD99_13572 [Oopsacas minuta]|uniref:VTT domain-containing protein n=1 Tax=Oopsacas minuta TaxID=111878 RepID=A0AAV7KJ13_9METZ|nr:hypothetical protein LOD99_13572 [Oopsacas minuta]